MIRTITYSRSRAWLRYAVVGAAYVVVANLSLSVAFEGTNASPVWPPSGIALAALLVFGARMWPAVAAGAFVANMVFLLSTLGAAPATALAASALISAANTAEAVIGAAMLRYLEVGADPLRGSRNAIIFAATSLPMCAVAALLGPLAMCSVGLATWPVYPTAALTWWLGDVAGVLVVTPVLVAWSRRPAATSVRGRWPEVALVFAVLAALTALIFGGWVDRDLAGVLDYLLVPALMWPAFRCEPRVWVVAVAVTQAAAVWGTVSGHGPFADAARNTSLLLLQAFVCEISIVAGEVVIACREEPESWRFSIRDDGVGIPERHFERVFLLFQALSPDRDPASTGIGLALVKRLVERHGGRVWLEPAEGAGATFFFTVPRGEPTVPTRSDR